jgi:hypothetical protein
MDLDLKRYRDEKKIYRLSYAAFLSYITVPVVAALLVVPLHEALHVLGAYMEGGVVVEFQYLIVENWVNQYLFLDPSGPIGKVVAQLPESGLLWLPSGTVYYFLPYIVSFPLAFYLLAGDNIGISNKWRLIGAPMLYVNLVALSTDYHLFLGQEGQGLIGPPVLYRVFYIAVILAGVMTVTWLQILNEITEE